MFKSSHVVEDVEQRPVWAWIDQAALRHNARRAIECAGGRTVIGVVKADGYGHGAADVARALLAEGVARLAVVSVAEGAGLRRDGIMAPILLLGGLDDLPAAERAVKWGLTPVLQDERGLALARRLGRAEPPLAIELEVDTGMRRMGVSADAADALLEGVSRTPELSLSGVFTHLARADEPDPAPSREQYEALAAILLAREESGGGAPDCHVLNSAGLLRLAEFEPAADGFATQAVRPGLMLYGVSPFMGEGSRMGGSSRGSGDADSALAEGGDGDPWSNRTAEALDLEPAMTLAAKVIAVRRIQAGDCVGYGGQWRAAEATTIATLPLGYADGIPRSVLGRGAVHLAGAMRPIVGRVSMDSVCLDVGQTPVEVGELATVFGRTPEGERIPVENLAAAAGTVGYEILVGVGARVPRRWGIGWPPGDGGRAD
ncbi:MAG: alanine racemase [bacterium]|nr:alanine racemase [bacterium]